MRFSRKNVLYGAAFGSIMLLLGFQAALELAGGFGVTITYTVIIGAFGLGIGWVNGTQAQKTPPFWMGFALAALPLGYVLYAYPNEMQLIFTLAWAIAIVVGLALACRKVWRHSATQQPTS